MGKTMLVGLVMGLAIGAIGVWMQPNAPEPPPFESDAQRHEWVISTPLPWIEQFRERYHHVPRSDGEFLRWLVIAAQRPDGRSHRYRPERASAQKIALRVCNLGGASALIDNGAQRKNSDGGD